ncbi:hypothetical protein AAL_04258 [Moelleriella libera RCEF 2490]|uniref:Infection structure specific protein n=1 Tax=Moelleriella libera RCEF 2490 TaxID=1081109 RepID=A0A162ILU8_9HYPO|nr:hypothetical protein AAL_04258 [Moelleriella libera RCEF 2490]
MRFTVLLLAGSVAATNTAHLVPRQTNSGDLKCLSKGLALRGAEPTPPPSLVQDLEDLKKAGYTPDSCGDFTNVPSSVTVGSAYRKWKPSAMSWLNSAISDVGTCTVLQQPMSSLLSDFPIPTSCVTALAALKTGTPGAAAIKTSAKSALAARETGMAVAAVAAAAGFAIAAL